MSTWHAMKPEERFAAEAMAREDLYFYNRYMFWARKGYKWQRARHHKLICDALSRVFYGETRLLVINVPPRYSKTELAVKGFTSWALGKVPDAEFILPSYAAALAESNSYDVREMISSEAYRGVFPETIISSGSSAKGNWETTRNGRVYAPGVGGATTGMGAGKMREGFGGAIIIDDPHKADEARSAIILGNVWSWYQETLQSRRNDPRRTPIILIMQRLNELDLAGHFLRGDTGETWEHLCLPAIYDEELPDGTKRKAALWPEKHSLEELLTMETAMPYTFAGQYMQSPSAAEGNIFKPDKIEIVDALPRGRIKWVRGWDFAASVPEKGKDPDYTVGFRLGELVGGDLDGKFVIADVNRDRTSPDGTEAMLLNTTKRDGHATYASIPQDPGQAGKAQVLNFTRKLRGYRVTSSPESGDKVVRAEPFAAQVNVGNVMMIKAPWNQALVDEMRVFPNGAHDDQVDAGSRAFNKLLEVPKGLVITDDHLKAAARK